MVPLQTEEEFEITYQSFGLVSEWKIIIVI